MRPHNIGTVGDLRRLLDRYPDDKPVGIAATPDVNGYIQPLLHAVGRSQDEERADMLILAAAEETLGEDDIAWADPTTGHPVRPV